jgi:protein-S-isoprenylcysteine O-methyltransferase Ste14
MMRWLALLYGAACYLLTGATLLYAVLFLNDAGRATTLDRDGGSSPISAAMIDLSLIILFGLQHSLMARVGFKRVWTRIVPAPVERSTYLLCSALALLLLCIFWLPLPGVVWNLSGTFVEWLLWFFAGLGCLLVLAASFQIDHWELSGLRQVWDYFRGRESRPVPFQAPALYRFSRHPMMAGFLLAFWAIPQMTTGRLLFNLGMTGYILLALQFEERDLLAKYGEEYRKYRSQVRMLI